MSAKRVLDLAIGIPAAVLATPVIVVLAALVLVTSGWPPLIVQTRVGAGERPIRVSKLRTMHRGTPTVAKSNLLRPGAPTGDPYTLLGRTLRRLSLDELPQLFQVVGGSMSLVGPRPALPSQDDLLALRRRCGVTGSKPGLTGLAQIRGREALTLPTKVRFEALYQRHASILFDLSIIARTVGAIMSRRGAL